MESRLKNKIQDESLDAAMTNVVADVLSRPDADSIIGIISSVTCLSTRVNLCCYYAIY